MTDADLLNANQRRHFEVLLSMLEDELLRVERLAVEPRVSAGSLTIVDDDLPPVFAERAPPLLANLRRLIRELATELGLDPRRVSRRRSINALLTAAVIRIDDSSPDQLLGYGSVDARFVDQVAPALGAIRASLLDLKGLLATPRRAELSQE